MAADHPPIRASCQELALIVRSWASTITSSISWLFSFQRTVLSGRPHACAYNQPKKSPAPHRFCFRVGTGRLRSFDPRRSAPKSLLAETRLVPRPKCAGPRNISRLTERSTPSYRFYLNRPRMCFNSRFSAFHHASRRNGLPNGRAKVATFARESSPYEELFSRNTFFNVRKFRATVKTRRESSAFQPTSRNKSGASRSRGSARCACPAFRGP
jgi:hypothetical protein